MKLCKCVLWLHTYTFQSFLLLELEVSDVQKSIHVSDILKFEFISSKILMKHFPCSALHKGLLLVISVETMQPALTPCSDVYLCMWGGGGGESGEGFSGTK